jgi:predicted heme/steroid binding protein/uncharacterized membrane protein
LNFELFELYLEKGAASSLTEPKKEFSLEEIKAFNGAEGKPVYIIYQDRVIDVSASKRWENGHHMGAHNAGQDLTREIDAAPHGPEVFERFPEVGILRQADAGREKVPDFLSRLFHYAPLLRRHPHPMLVHFPIVFMISTAGFNTLFLLTGNRSFEVTAWYCLWGGVLFSLPAMATGLFTWWINYEAEYLRQVIIKMILSPLMFLLGTALLIWRYLDPEILVSLQPVSYLYLAGSLALAVMAAAIGWFGGTLSFPLEGD